MWTMCLLAGFVCSSWVIFVNVICCGMSVMSRNNFENVSVVVGESVGSVTVCLLKAGDVVSCEVRRRLCPDWDVVGGSGDDEEEEEEVRWRITGEVLETVRVVVS